MFMHYARMHDKIRNKGEYWQWREVGEENKQNKKGSDKETQM